MLLTKLASFLSVIKAPIPYLVILIVNPKPLPEISEHHGAVLLKLEAAGEVLSGEKQRRVSVNSLLL